MYRWWIRLVVAGLLLTACVTADTTEPVPTGPVLTSLASTTTTPPSTAPVATTTSSSTTSTTTTTTTTLPPPPRLEIVDPEPDGFVVGATYTFRGITDPGCTVDVAGKYFADVDTDGNWSIGLKLHPGGNATTLTATDPHGTTTDVPIRVTRLLGLSEAIVGGWEGQATVPSPWNPIGWVQIEFRSDGTWIGEGERGQVFYAGPKESETPRPYQVWGAPVGSPEPELQRTYPPPEVCGPLPRLCMPAYGSAGRGWLADTLPQEADEEHLDQWMVRRLENIVVTDNELHFESWRDRRGGTYGPVVYDLTRVN